jgi:hypothetical protein
MAVTYQSTGTTAYSTGNPAPGYPASIASGDLLVLVVGTKPSTTPATTPSGWTLLGAFAGTTGTQGIDTGPMRVGVFYKIADGTESGTQSVTVTGNNVSAASIYRFSNATGAWDVNATFGEDTSGGTSWSAVCNSAGSYDFASGDHVLFGGIIPTDVTTPAQFSAEAITASGATFAAATEIEEWDTSSGQDMGAFIAWSSVSSGSSTSAPTVTATAGGTTTNVYGPSFVVRVRQIAQSAFNGDAARAETVSFTTTATVAKFGDASLTASFVYGDTFATVPAEQDINYRTVFPLGPGGSTAKTDDATQAQTVTITAAGSMSVTGSATAVAESVTITAAGNRTNAGTATVASTVSITSAGSVSASGGATLTATVGLTAAGNRTNTGSATVASTVSITSTATVNRFGDATLTEGVSVTTAGNVATFGNATLTGTVAFTADGAATGSNNAPVSETVTITAAGVAGYQRGATAVAQTVTITATATVNRNAGATAAETVTITAAGAAGKSTGATVAETVTVAADGSVGRATGSTLALSVTLTASASVSIPAVGQVTTNFYFNAVGTGTVTVPVILYRVNEPKFKDYWNTNVLLGRYGVDVGQTIIVKNGTVTFTDAPLDTELADADWYVLGGRDDRITEAQAQDLINAGYGSLVELVT